MKYRDALPQLAGTLMLTDGGLETTLMLHNGIDLPLLAAFKALETDKGMSAIDAYMNKFAEIAIRNRVGFVMDTPTWRASARWAAELGVSHETLRAVHREAVCNLERLRTDLERDSVSPFVINGVIGPQDNGYAPTKVLTAAQSKAYHTAQVGWFAEFGADMVSAVAMTYADEAVGIAVAAKDKNIPVAISFIIEENGRLPSGETLFDAIQTVDDASDGYPVYFMINCAQPEQFSHIAQGEWTNRIKGLRANASRMSRGDLDVANDLNPDNLDDPSVLFAELVTLFPNLTVLGGCCGADHRQGGETCNTTHVSELRKDHENSLDTHCTDFGCGSCFLRNASLCNQRIERDNRQSTGSKQFSSQRVTLQWTSIEPGTIEQDL